MQSLAGCEKVILCRSSDPLFIPFGIKWISLTWEPQHISDYRAQIRQLLVFRKCFILQCLQRKQLASKTFAEEMSDFYFQQSMRCLWHNLNSKTLSF